MKRIWQNRERWSAVVSVLCVVMMLVVGTAQAVHSHPDNEKSARHTCSICSTPNAKLNTSHASPVPVMVAAPIVSVEALAPRIGRPITSNFVRPPPAV
jgi:L-asparagine transporter-like permease